VNACEVKAYLIGCRQNLGAVCFWEPILPVLNLVVTVVLRDSLCVVSLLPCVADCCMCKVERLVSTIIKRRLLLLLSVKLFCKPVNATDRTIWTQSPAIKTNKLPMSTVTDLSGAVRVVRVINDV